MSAHSQPPPSGGGVVAVSASESERSRTRSLADAILRAAGGGRRIDLVDLSAEGLLGRTSDTEVAEAVAAASSARMLVLASPIYRAAISGAMKCFLDRFDPDALKGTIVVLAATASVPHHFLALDAGARPLVASLGGTCAPSVVYAFGADFVDDEPTPALSELVRRVVDEALRHVEGMSGTARR